MTDEANHVKTTSTSGTHHLKSHPRYFKDACDGSRPFEIRLDDRDFRVWDKVVLLEWDPERWKKREASGHTGREVDGYTGRELTGVITCVTRGVDLLSVDADIIRDGYVVLGIKWSYRP